MNFPVKYLAVATFILLSGLRVARAAESRPNIVIIFADDLGYGDVGCFGAKGYTTPNLDRMAREGIRFTDFHAAQPVCSASRTGLLTGCYPNRLSIHGALSPNSRIGISAEEKTIADILKADGYATGMVGKWHLGSAPPFLPTRHGFDEYLGIPYSHDMWPNHPEARPGTYPPLPLYDGENVAKLGLGWDDLAQLTTCYTERAVSFIERKKDGPFFLYLAHNLPHVPLAVSDKFRGKTERGLYGDVISEIDWSVGQILSTLARLGLDEKTLVLFTSDNGPWLSYGDHAGSAGTLREGKGTSWEGGHREPFIARWPGHIRAGAECHEAAMTIDLLPTIAKLTGAKLPEKKIDGLDIWPLLAGEPGAKCPHDAFYFYYQVNELQAVRSGPWKLVLPHTYRTLNGRPGGTGGKPVKYESAKAGLDLYDMRTDYDEKANVAAEHPDEVKQLEAIVERARADLGDSLTKRTGSGIRPPGHVVEPGKSATAPN